MLCYCFWCKFSWRKWIVYWRKHKFSHYHFFYFLSFVFLCEIFHFERKTEFGPLINFRLDIHFAFKLSYYFVAGADVHFYWILLKLQSTLALTPKHFDQSFLFGFYYSFTCILDWNIKQPFIRIEITEDMDRALSGMLDRVLYQVYYNLLKS